MSKRYPPAKYVLPATIDPARICTTVLVPNDPQHIAAFLGAIRGLGSAINWQDDLSHTAKDVAAVWRDVFDLIVMGNCAQAGSDDVQFRQNGCLLEFSVDCVNWQTLYDPTGCFGPGVTQPSGEGELSPDQCKTYHVVLQGNNVWRLPVKVTDGYTITITNVQGAWSDGSGPWNCPNGQPYVLGACVGAGGTASGDPAPLIDHMRLIAVFSAGGSIDAFETAFTIGSGIGDTDVDFQANDSDLTNNLGSISFDVEVCATAEPSWCYEFDFLTSDGGFTNWGSGASVWVSGSGWHGTGSDADRITIQKTLPAACHITTITALLENAAVSGYSFFMRMVVDTTNIDQVYPFVGGPSVVFNVNADASSLIATLFEKGTGDTTTQGYLQKLTVRGTGANPFGTDNCT